jgi:hypothetical protein
MRLTLFFTIFSTFSYLYGQQIASTPDEIEKQYNINIKKTRIDGYYIPKDIEEATVEFIRLSPKESIDKFKNAEEDFVVKKLHYGLGKWLATNWNFYEGSRYSHMLRMKGVADPNDMIQVTLRSLHRALNNRPIDLAAQAEIVKEIRKKEHLIRINQRETLEQKTIPIDSTKQH